jgi:hypothetical protein
VCNERSFDELRFWHDGPEWLLRSQFRSELSARAGGRLISEHFDATEVTFVSSEDLMRFLLTLLCLPGLCLAEHVVVDFQEVSSYYQGSEFVPISLGHFFDGGPGGNLGFAGRAESFVDAFVVNGILHFPLHGPNVLYVKGGFEGRVSFEYSGYLSNPQYSQSILLKHKGQLVTEYRIGQTPYATYSTVTINVEGAADEIDFGIDSDGTMTGNAGDMTYKYFEFSNLHRPDDPVKPAPPVRSGRIAPTQQSDAASFRSRVHGKHPPVR